MDENLKRKLLKVIYELLDAIQLLEHNERTTAEILESNLSNVLTHEEQMNLLDVIVDMERN